MVAHDQEKLILLVDDENDILYFARILLESVGEFVVLSACDGRRALRLLDVIEPDLVITDMMMPVMDGFHLLREYKARPRAAPVIATSAFEPYLEQALKLGADAALPKPFEGAALVSVVRQVLDRKRPPEWWRSTRSPMDEEARLRTILDLNLDQPASEPELRRFVDEVAAHFGVPVALVSIVTADRQFWTAACGLPADLAEARGTPRQDSFCTHAVAAHAALVVQDTLDNPFFRHNPLVQMRGLRFYAGVPLTGRHGDALGTLCLLDFHPRPFTHKDLELLAVFGRCVLAALEWREHLGTTEIPVGAFRYLEYLDRELGILGAAGFRALAIVEAARGAEAATPVSCVGLAVPFRRLREVVEALRAQSPHGLIGRLGQARLGWLVPGLGPAAAREAGEKIAPPHSFVEAVELVGYCSAVQLALQDLEQAMGDAGLA